MSLHQTSFCFICSHLTSGQKEGDELRRNSDVMEILRKTRFPRVHGIGDENSPETILEHEFVSIHPISFFVLTFILFELLHSVCPITSLSILWVLMKLVYYEKLTLAKCISLGTVELFGLVI